VFDAREDIDAPEEGESGVAETKRPEDEKFGDGAAAAKPIPSPRWLLHRIEAIGVGGVTGHGPRPFVLDVLGESLAVDGLNGQGKSSLISLVMMSLTGYRMWPTWPLGGRMCRTVSPGSRRQADGQMAPCSVLSLKLQ
jgi:hypothetical protein